MHVMKIMEWIGTKTKIDKMRPAVIDIDAIERVELGQCEWQSCMYDAGNQTCSTKLTVGIPQASRYRLAVGDRSAPARRGMGAVAMPIRPMDKRTDALWI